MSVDYESDDLSNYIPSLPRPQLHDEAPGTNHLKISRPRAIEAMHLKSRISGYCV